MVVYTYFWAALILFLLNFHHDHSGLSYAAPSSTPPLAFSSSATTEPKTCSDDKDSSMPKTILITGSTDGIGLETAKMLVSKGHRVLLHGRNPSKLKTAVSLLSSSSSADGTTTTPIESYTADLSAMAQVETLASKILEKHDSLDVLINNAGVFHTSTTTSVDGLDTRFAVNTLAPYLLTKRLQSLLGNHGRIVNISSAAQSPVRLDALAGRTRLSDDFGAYAQSKLAQIMWTKHLAEDDATTPTLVSVNPGSMLGTKMVRDGFGVPGRSIDIGADILVQAAVGNNKFGGGKRVSGKYFDNDSGQFNTPHRDAMDPNKCSEVVRVMEEVLERIGAATTK